VWLQTPKEDTMNVGQAVNDTTTALGRDAALMSEARAKRIAAAYALVEAEGITLEEAVKRVWASVTLQA
jgi:hypothetical protein